MKRQRQTDIFGNIRYGKVITVTLGDQAENSVHMQKIGKLKEHGLSEKDMFELVREFRLGYKCFLHDLTQSREELTHIQGAYLLVIKNFIGDRRKKDLFNELEALDWDKKKVLKMNDTLTIVTSRRSYNLCFSDFEQKPDLENRKGRVVKWDDVPVLKEVKEELENVFQGRCGDLQGEGNYYFDAKKCNIGWHGDEERKVVVGLRVGDDFPLRYQWRKNWKNVGEEMTFTLSGGDVYIMSEKAVGHDWKDKDKYVLTHSAGIQKQK